MAGKQSKFSQHLECPVCLDIYRDPRLLPCAHTICKHCIQGLTHSRSLTCPVCRAGHDTRQVGVDGFMCNLAVAGMVDSLCKGCRSSESNGKCPHCDAMLCGDCQSGHLSFDVAKQTLQGVDQTITEGKNAASEVRRITDIEVTSRKAWIEHLNVRLETNEAELADLTSRLGYEWRDNITQNEIAYVDEHGKQMIDQMKQFLVTNPIASKPTFLNDDFDAFAEIRSFGSINISPPDAADTMAAVSCFVSTYTKRPRVVGRKGSGSVHFSYPCDVAVCPMTGRVMVADHNIRKVHVLDDNFVHIMDIRAAGQFGDLQPWGVAVTSTGNVIVSHSGDDRVSMYGGAGTHLCDLPEPWSRPRGITVDTDDNVYVCDAGTYTVRVINTACQVIRTLGGHGTGLGQLSEPPCYIAVWRDDVILLDGAGRLHMFRTIGEFIELLGLGIMHHAQGLTVDPSGNLVIADRDGPVTVLRDNRATRRSGESDNRAPRRVGESDNRASRRVGESGKETWQLFGAQGVAITKSGQLVVANSGHDNLLVYEVET